MKPSYAWTIGGNFVIGDAEDEDAPVITVTLAEPFKSLAIENREWVGEIIATAMRQTPHPYAEQADD